jgi:hypothetical protein
MAQNKNHDFLKTWGVIGATILVQVGIYIAGDARLKEDVKTLVAEVKALNDFKSSYTVKVDEILNKIRGIK